jgi:L-rhamnose mutarotase
LFQLVQREQHSRQEYEKAAREDSDRKWTMLKKVLEEELHAIKENMGVTCYSIFIKLLFAGL